MDIDSEEESPPSYNSEDYHDQKYENVVLVQCYQTELKILDHKYKEEIANVEEDRQKSIKIQYEKRNIFIQKLPYYWTTAMINHPILSQVISEEEEDCLYFLTNFEVEEFGYYGDFRFKFYFNSKDNPYFTNDILVKQYCLNEDGHFIVVNTVIGWKKNMDLTKRVHQENYQNGKFIDSFFNWLCNDNVQYAPIIKEVLRNDLWRNPTRHYIPKFPEEYYDSNEDEEMTEAEDDDRDDDEEVCDWDMEQFDEKQEKSGTHYNEYQPKDLWPGEP